VCVQVLLTLITWVLDIRVNCYLLVVAVYTEMLNT